MKGKQFSTEYIAFLCGELKLIMKAGISLGEAFSVMADEESDKDTAAVLRDIGEKIDMGEDLQEVFTNSGRFPKHMTDMIALGYQTGYLEDVFEQLSKYYDRETRLANSIRTAVTYPAVLMAMMLCVILILIVKVLPVFKSVFDQLGGTMSPIALGLMNTGVFLGNHIIAVCIVIACLIALFIYAIFRSRQEGKMTVFMTKGLQKKAGAARFAAAIAMAVGSGIEVDDALDMTLTMEFDSITRAGIERAKQASEEGENIAEAMNRSGLFSNIHGRMITLGYKAGSIDDVMQEVADSMERNVNDELDALVGKIEPTLVIVLSVVTGVILLSVMLPLMGIMSAIG